MTTRSLKSVKVRFIIYTLAVTGILFYSLILVGCTSLSPGISGLFLVEIQDLRDNSTSIRVGYFGICSRHTMPNSTAQTLCSSTTSTSAVALSESLLAPGSLAQYGLDLRKATFPPFLAVGGMSLLLGFASFLLLKMTLRTQHSDRNKYKKQNTSSRVLLLLSITHGFVWLSVGVALTVAYTTTIVLSGLGLVTSRGPQSTTKLVRGEAVEVLQWSLVGVLAIFGLGIKGTLQLQDYGSEAGTSSPIGFAAGPEVDFRPTGEPGLPGSLPGL